MIHIILGTDAIKKKSFLNTHRNEQYPGTVFLSFDSLDFDKVAFEQYISGESLFEKNEGYILYGLLGNEDQRSFFIQLFEKHGNENSKPIYFVDETAPKSFLDSLPGTLLTTINKQEAEPDFALFQAIYSRNKKIAWQAYLQKIQVDPVEMVHGSIVSQVKNMYKVTFLDGDFKELGFSTAKSEAAARRGAKLYLPEELASIYKELVLMPTVARSSGITLELALEKFILEKI